MASFPVPTTSSNIKSKQQCRLSLLQNEEEAASLEKIQLTERSGIPSDHDGGIHRNDIFAPLWKPPVPPPPSHPPLEPWRPLHSVFNFSLSTLLTVLFYTGLPVLSSFFVLFGIFPRFFVKLALRFCDGGKFQLLPVSRIFGSMDKNNHTAMFVCRGRCDIDKIRACLLKAINAKDSSGAGKFSHLQKRVTTKFGYLCLENRSSNFDIKSHVKHFDIRSKNVAVNADEIIPYLESTYSNPFENYLTAPQWEVLVVPKYTNRKKEGGLHGQNCEDDENLYALIFRFHNGIMNWNMLQELVLATQEAKGRDTPIFTPFPKDAGCWRKLKMTVACPLVGPQAFVRSIFKGWSVFAGMKSLQDHGKISFAVTRPISSEALEDIKERTHTGATSILGSCARISVRNMVLGQNVDFPKAISVVRAFNTTSSKLPRVDSFRTNFQRFRSCLERLHTTYHAIDLNEGCLGGQRSFNAIMIYLAGFFPVNVSAWLYKTLMKADAVIEIWSGPEVLSKLFDDGILEDLYGWSGVTGIDANFKITVTNYCGRIRGNVIGKLGQLSGGRADAQIIADEFEVEFEHLASAVALYPQQVYLPPVVSVYH